MSAPLAAACSTNLNSWYAASVPCQYVCSVYAVHMQGARRVRAVFHGGLEQTLDASRPWLPLPQPTAAISPSKSETSSRSAHEFRRRLSRPLSVVCRHACKTSAGRGKGRCGGCGCGGDKVASRNASVYGSTGGSEQPGRLDQARRS